MNDERGTQESIDGAGWDRESLVPPRRLGALLSEARAHQGDTLEDLADRSLGRFSLATLSSIERGSREVNDDEARVLASLYHLESSTVVPPRSKLIVDLDEGMLTVDDQHLRVGRKAPSRDEVLSRYLTLVYSMRHIQPGSPMTLRVDDLDVLGRALRIGSSTVEADLESLMAHPEQLVGWRGRALRRRVLIPAAGIMVAALGVGALLLVQGPSGNDATTTPTPTRSPAAAAVATTGATQTPTAPVISADIGNAVVQERLADGTPGPVEVRHGDGSVQPATPSDVGLIAPESTVRAGG